MDVKPATQTPARPSLGTRVVLDLALPIGSGAVAETVRKSLLKKGSVPAIAGGVLAAAAFKGVAEATVQVVTNASAKRPLNEGVIGQGLNGLRGGAIDAGLAFTGPAVQGKLAPRLAKLGPVLLVATSNAVTAVGGAVVRTATDYTAWENGAKEGLKRIGWGMAGAAGTAFLAGAAVKGAMSLIPASAKPSWLPYPFNG